MVFCIANVIGNVAINGKSYEMRIELMMCSGIVNRQNMTNLGKFDHDLTATEAWNHGFHKANHPQPWPQV